MIFGDLGGLKPPDICLTGEEKPRKNLTQETCPGRRSNPDPLRDKRACYHLLHSGGHLKKDNLFYFVVMRNFQGGATEQAISSSLPNTEVPSSNLDLSTWVSWWMKQKVFSGFHLFNPATNFSTFISFISFHKLLLWCDRHCRSAPLLFTDLQYRSFISFLHASPCRSRVEKLSGI